MTTEKRLSELVKQELINLKKYATPEEINKLISATILLPSSQSQCIYGIMTGGCNSERSIELIQLCCPTYINRRNALRGFLGITDDMFSNNNFNRNEMLHYSAIEFFLFAAKESEIINAVGFLCDEQELNEIQPEFWKEDRVFTTQTISI